MPSTVKITLSESRTESHLSNPSIQDAIPAPSQLVGKRVHFIGIGGCGMSGLANVLLDAGAIVSGSEPNRNATTFNLVSRGANISQDQMGKLLSRQVALVVRSAAVPDNNPEYLGARALGIRTVKYAQFLGAVMRERFGVAVAGTHGKSTTTAMISWALLQCGADPSFVIGGTVKQLGGGSRSGRGQDFVVEACEYDRSFHNLHPRVALLMNIEEDHMDYYKNLDEIVESFHEFAGLVPPDGTVIANGLDQNVRKALAASHANIETVALKTGYQWSTLETGQVQGCYRGQVYYRNKPVAKLELGIPGEHNLFNATMAVAACAACGIEPARAARALGDFQGVDRRMAEVGRCNGAVLVDDYGHHPTEIRATLEALRGRYQPRRLLCVFQPHQYSRTRFLLKDFAASFGQADETIVPDIYFVRDSDEELKLVNSDVLVSRIRQNGQKAVHFPQFADIIAYLRGSIGPGDLVVTMGAGDVWKIASALAE